ncbi:MAG: hypothetical protein HYZ74_08875, partial [Elusimicrobia bacterium]|nr:hypothetical protein [Elusimicrobiota bacterium]
VFGSEGALFSYSGLRPATPHTLCYALTLFPANRAEIDRELARLSAAPPRFIVWSTQPLSTLMASRLGESYRDEMLRVLGRGYDYAGRVAVTDSPALPVFQAAGRGARAPFDAGDALLLFERR